MLWECFEEKVHILNMLRDLFEVFSLSEWNALNRRSQYTKINSKEGLAEKLKS